MKLQSQQRLSRSLLLRKKTDMPLRLLSSPHQQRMLLLRLLLRKMNRRKLPKKPKTLRSRLRLKPSLMRIRLKTMLSRKQMSKSKKMQLRTETPQ